MGNSVPLPPSVVTQIEHQRQSQLSDGSFAKEGLRLDLSRQPDFKAYLEHSASENISSEELQALPSASELKNLTSLRLDFHAIDSMSSFSGYKHVQLLSCRFNRIVTISHDISSLKNITHLDLHSNRLTMLPPELWKLTKLEHLDLSSNHISELSPSIINLTALRRLNVKSNSLIGLPAELGRLSHLNVLISTVNRCKNPPQAVCDNGSAYTISYLRDIVKAPRSTAHIGRFGHITAPILETVGHLFGCETSQNNSSADNTTTTGSGENKTTTISSLSTANPLHQQPATILSSMTNNSPSLIPSPQPQPVQSELTLSLLSPSSRPALAIPGRIPVSASDIENDARQLISQHFSDCDIAWASGSLLRGQGTSTSDIDMVIIYLTTPTKPFFGMIDNNDVSSSSSSSSTSSTPFTPILPYRASFHANPSKTSPRNGWPIEVFVHTPASLRDYFDRDRKSRKPSLANMVSEGRVIHRSKHPLTESTIINAVGDARILLNNGPPPLTPSELTMMRYGITSLIDDLYGDEHSDESVYTAIELAQCLRTFWLGFQRKWQGSGKWSYRTLYNADPVIAKQLTFALRQSSQESLPNHAPLIELANKILSVTGGPVFDGLYSDCNGARVLLTPTSSSTHLLHPVLSPSSSDENSVLTTTTTSAASTPSSSPSRLHVPPPITIPSKSIAIPARLHEVKSNEDVISMGTPPIRVLHPLPEPLVSPPQSPVLPAISLNVIDKQFESLTSLTPDNNDTHSSSSSSSSSSASSSSTSSSSSSVIASIPPSLDGMSPDFNRFIDRVAGCIFGGAIGDAIGVATEFMDRDEANFNYRAPLHYRSIVQDRHRIKFRRGHFTDDTSQALVIILSMLENKGNVIPIDIGQRLAFWADKGFPELGDTVGWGIGNTVGQVLSHSEFQSDPHRAANAVYVSSGRRLLSNGAVMRTGVVAVMNAMESLEKCIADTRSACLVTHAAPQCIASCVAVTTAIQGILQGKYYSSTSSIDSKDANAQYTLLAQQSFVNAIGCAFPGCPPQASLAISATSVSESILPADATATEIDLASELWQYLAPNVIPTPQLTSPTATSSSVPVSVPSTPPPTSTLSSSPSTPSSVPSPPLVAVPFYDWRELGRLKLDDGRSIGYTYKTTGAAFWALRSGLDFESAITALTLEAGDADTNATVAGALLGARYGYHCLPRDWVDGLLHKEYLTQLVHRVIHHYRTSSSSSSSSPSVSSVPSSVHH